MIALRTIGLLLLGGAFITVSAADRHEPEWTTLVSPHFSIHHVPAEAEAAEFTARTAEEVFAAFAPKLGLEWHETNSIFIYPDKSYLVRNALYGQGRIDLDLGGDVDLFKHRVIIAPDPSVDVFRRTIKRLVLRALIYRKLMGTGGNIMRIVKSVVYAEWLILGTCEYLSAPADPLREAHFRALRRADRLFRLTELYNFDYLSRSRQRTALAQSAAMVRWIVETWGEEKLWTLFSTYPDYWSNDRLLREVLSVDQVGFLKAFREASAYSLPAEALTPGIRRLAWTGDRFAGDASFPVVHEASGTVMFTGERDGMLNAFRIVAPGTARRILREVPTLMAEALLTPLRMEGDCGVMGVVRFGQAARALIAFNADGSVREVTFAPLPSRETAWLQSGYNTIAEYSLPDGGAVGIYADRDGDFIGRRSGTRTAILLRPFSAIAGITYAQATGRVYYSISPDGSAPHAIYSMTPAGVDVRRELSAPGGASYPAAGRGELYFTSPEIFQQTVCSVPFNCLAGIPADIIMRTPLPDGEPDIAFIRLDKANTLSPDIVIPGILWNASDEFGRNEFWVSLGMSTGLISTSGFENDEGGAFLTPLLQVEYLHRFNNCDFLVNTVYEYGDVLDMQHYETRNRFTAEIMVERTLNTRLVLGAGLRGEFLERLDPLTEEYNGAQDVGGVVRVAFDGVIMREWLPRRGLGVLLDCGRFLEGWGSTATYTRVEFNADAFVPVTDDSTLQLFGGLWAADGAEAPTFDLGRTRGVLSQPVGENAGRFMAVGRLAYRFPLARDLNWTASGVILMKQVRMGFFADMGIVSDEPFDAWAPGEPFLTVRRTAGIFFLCDVYPVEGFQMPIVLTWGYDPVHDTSQIKLEFNLYF